MNLDTGHPNGGEQPMPRAPKPTKVTFLVDCVDYSHFKYVRIKKGTVWNDVRIIIDRSYANPNIQIHYGKRYASVKPGEVRITPRKPYEVEWHIVGWVKILASSQAEADLIFDDEPRRFIQVEQGSACRWKT
jgi:hypothetical protein